ncbi:MAG TPA: L,D-transpeptidase family protein [Blastocatellia bacterium]|nr:L,D-transpeptidase family protein [Blastocatellia bacterium]
MKRIDIKPAMRLILIVLAMGSVVTINANAQQKPTRKQAKAPASQTITREDIREAEQSLSDLGYWTGEVDGKMDAATRSALIAFQKVEGRATTGRLTRAEMLAIRSASRPSPLETGYAHVEADLDRQVLFVVDASGAVSKILPISSGNGEEFTSEGWTRRAVTPTGRFKIYRKVDGWRKAPLGDIYYPNYFLSGVAIHGSASVPARPASHGCIRIPVFAAKEFSEMTPNGTVVIVHSVSALAQGKGVSSAQR